MSQEACAVNFSLLRPALENRIELTGVPGGPKISNVCFFFTRMEISRGRISKAMGSEVAHLKMRKWWIIIMSGDYGETLLLRTFIFSALGRVVGKIEIAGGSGI